MTVIDAPVGRAQLTAFPDNGRDELYERGRVLRETAPRTSHAGWTPPPDRPDPLELTGWTNRNRVPELVPIRWGRMLASPFAHFRGSPYVMAHDLASTARTGINVQICGDAHLMNFGLYATPERHLVFDANDFDETLPGPWEWDLKRLAASLVVASRANGFTERKAIAAATAVGRAYRTAMATYADTGILHIWYERLDLDEMALTAESSPLAQAQMNAINKARANTNLRAFEKLTEVVDGRLQIAEDPPVIERITDPRIVDHTSELMDCYLATLPDDRRLLLHNFRFVDAARKVVGVGSVGTRCSIVLLVGRVNGEPLFLQVKEAEDSILEPFVGTSPHSNHAQRVVIGQHYMQAVSDMMLGWAGFDGRCFYVRQLRDMKGSADVAAMNPAQLRDYAAVCAGTLARAHARSGLAAVLSGYLGQSTKFDDSLAAFAVDYADQNERDFELLERAVREGRIEAHTGV
jgi:uncharacterized protein (DUF2252 family)